MKQLCFVCAITLLAACGGDSSTSPASINVVGSYQLKTVNGTALPFGSTSGSTRAEITSDVFSLNADGTWSEQTGYRVTQGVTVTTTMGASIGVYRATNGAVQFTQTTPTSGTFSGTVNSNTMTVLLGGATYVYDR